MALLKVPALFLILTYYLILMSNNGDGAREITKHEQDNKIRLPMDHDSTHPATKHKNHNHPHSLHLDVAHLQFKKVGFFTLNDLYVGKVFPMKLPINDPLRWGFFLPKERADKIPFSLKQLPNLLNFFSIPPGTPEAYAFEDTLILCEAEPLKGETKFCGTSLESTLEFVRSVLGLETHFKALTTKYQSTTHIEHNYTVLEAPKEVMAPEMVACHLMDYPYGVFYCHTQTGGNKVFEVTLEAENGHRVEGVVVCHMDTSHWRNDNLFHQLGAQPSSTPICHIFSQDNIVWVPITK